MKTKTNLLSIVGTALFALSADAQSPTLDWQTISAGGGTSAGGVYSISATAGQPGVGTAAGSSYSLAGGYWGIIATVSTPDAPRLSMIPIDRAVIIKWPLPATGFVLETTANVSDPAAAPTWTPVNSPYLTNLTDILVTVPRQPGNAFFRLRKP